MSDVKFFNLDLDPSSKSNVRVAITSPFANLQRSSKILIYEKEKLIETVVVSVELEESDGKKYERIKIKKLSDKK